MVLCWLVGTFVYFSGITATLIDQINDNVDREYEAIRAGAPDDPTWVTFTLGCWAVFVSMIWPVYWAGRALYEVPERLALNPGEPQ